MKCEDLLRALNDYVDGEIDPAVCEGFGQHLEGCNPCEVVVDNIRGAIRLYQGDCEYPMPPEFHDRMRNILRQKFEEKFRSPPE